MSDWPESDHAAVYLPPPIPTQPPSQLEIKAQLAAWRVQLGVPCDEDALNAIMARRANPDAPPENPLSNEEMAEVRRKYHLTDRVGRLHSRHEFDHTLGWQDGRHLMTVYLTEDQTEVRRALESVGSDRLVIETARHSVEEIDRRTGAIMGQRHELEALGIELNLVNATPGGATIEIRYRADDPQAAEQVLYERFGEIVNPRWAGATGTHTFTAFPFGSWLAEGDRLTVFYGLGLNDQRPGGCLAFETERAVIVSLQILVPRGAHTLIGGFRASHATVQLKEPLGQRTVIDDAEHRRRPHWSEV